MDTVPPSSFPASGDAPPAPSSLTREELEAALAAANARADSLENQFADLLSALPMGLLLVDAAATVERANPRLRELFGLGPRTAAADAPTLAEISSTFENPTAFSSRLRSLREQGQTVLHEAFALADGRVVELDYLVPSQARGGRFLCFRDVTERYRNDAWLRSISYIPQQSPGPILRLNATGEVVYANAAAAFIVQTMDVAGLQSSLRQEMRGIVQASLRSKAFFRRELAVGARYYLCNVAVVPNENEATLYLTDISARRQAEQQLAEQRTFYETILEQVPTALAVVDADFRYLFANPALEPNPTIRAWLLGKTNEEVGQRRQMPVEIIESRRQYFEQTVRERREISWEERFHDGQREQRLFRQLRPVYDSSGALRFLVGSGIDITARREAEEKVTRQQEFYESVLNYLPVDIAVFDAEFRHVFVNPSSISDPEVRRKIIGMTNAEYFAYRQRPIALSADREKYFRLAVRTRTDTSWEETLPTPTGFKRILRTFRAVFQDDDTLQLVVGSGINITARYEAEERQRQSETLLREQQAFIRLIVNTLPNVVYVIGADDRISFHNAAFDAMAARSRHIRPTAEQNEEVQAQLTQIKEWRTQVLTTQQPLSVELPLTMESGETCHLQVQMRPIVRAGDEPAVLIVSTDITDLKHAQQVADANARAKDTFLARMSHEIRTPLNGVLGMAALLQKTPLTPGQQEYLATMQRAGQHLLTLVNDVLDLAKITAHSIELDHAPFDVAVLLVGAGQTVAALAAQKEVELLIEPLVLDSPRVLGDAYRLHQVLLNLLGNALKFTERGAVRLGATLVEATPAAYTLRFWVEDTGIGIAPEQQERIFESFTQASSDTSRHFGGTGLGLAISEQLVHQMGGALRLCSQVGVGTTFAFTLVLPIATEAAPAVPPAVVVSYEKLNGLRVLLAEDNVVNQWIARVLLEHWGVEVQAVANGTDALMALTTRSFDAALLDIQMPGLSGVEVTTTIRQHADPARAAIPIIALTANAFEADREKYLAAGMNGCITKPFEEAELCQLLLYLTHRLSTPEQP
jgi:PAS domain S-box-containing protein